MNHTNNHNATGNEDLHLDAELEAMSASLDRLGEAERASAPSDFDARMASTTMFALSAARKASVVPAHAKRLSSWLRIAAVVAVFAAGAIWTLSGSPTGGTSGTKVEVADTTATNAVSEGDDSEVYSLVALALDGGISSDVDYLASDASELHQKIGETPSYDDVLEGSTM